MCKCADFKFANENMFLLVDSKAGNSFFSQMFELVAQINKPFIMIYYSKVHNLHI